MLLSTAQIPHFVRNDKDFRSMADCAGLVAPDSTRSWVTDTVEFSPAILVA
jgi:hypothetical protein